MTGQNDRQDESLTRQVHNQAGHCLLTGCYFEPCNINCCNRARICDPLVTNATKN